MKTLILAVALVLSLMTAVNGQDRPQDYVGAHNRARSAVGVGPIQWDERVADYARDYANRRRGDCRLIHSGGPYGENLAWSSRDLSGVAAVQLWVNEKDDYHYRTNTCRAGKQCGHYTQVVWKKSVKLGCAKVKCNNGGTFIICNYDPPGNVRGQWPY
ncbi:PREDICTED: pathogenesis-related protein 1-like [Tarenaya hassleriana]|uniref:pathogenesis-related protein 1-like n=1 Tax=Tarenaya hassleriana TaxID=28532 RepID=UPI00053C5267|nr:PREDICTED: pathogenesis-related protein 1-like [Tarenaya hassleriana]